MSNYFFQIKILIVALMSINYLFSQTSISNVFEAKSDFQPSIKSSQKYDEIPSVLEDDRPPISYTYGINSMPYFPTYTISSIFPSTLKSERKNRLYHAFLKLGYSPFYSMPFGQLSISNSYSKNYHLHADFTHFSSQSSFSPYPVTSFSDNILRLNGKKFYKKHTLTGNFDYQRNVVYYYGFNTEKNIIPPERKSFLRQRYQLFHPVLELKSHYRDTTKINHEIKAGFYNYSNLHRETENQIHAQINTDMYLRGEHFVSDAYVLFFNNRQAGDTSNHFIFSLRPAFTAKDKKWNGRIGVRATMAHDQKTSSGRFYFHPDLLFEWNLADHLLIPFLQINGNLQRNSLFSITRENPFSDTILFFRNTNYRANFTLGLKGQLSSHTNYLAQVTYSVTEHLPYFLTNYNTLNELHHFYSVIYMNTSVLHVKGQVRYRLLEKINIMLYGNYYHFDPDSNMKPYHKPEYHLGAALEYHLGNKISFLVNTDYIGQRWALSKDDKDQFRDIRIPAIIDVNFQAEYRYTKFLGIFIRLNNLAHQKYYLWDKYPVYGFSGMVGLSFIPF